MAYDKTKRIAITGIGAVTPFGIGADAFWSALVSGASAIAPVTHFDVSRFRAKQAASVPPCDWAKLVGRKDTWSGSRSVSFTLAAAALALEHAGIEVTAENRPRIGVALGTTLACLNLMARFDQQALREGPRTCDPMLFPDTGVSAPACRISIAFGVNAFNITLSNGATSGLDAIHYGAEAIRKGLAHTVLAGGMEELCLESFAGAHAQGLLSGSREGQAELCAPLDCRRNGIVLGEGCAILVLEEYEHARERGARIWAEVLGYGTAFHPGASGTDLRTGQAVCRSMRKALQDAALDADQVDLVGCSANSSPLGDVAESTAIRCVFGGRPTPFVTAIKSMLGESYSASGAMQAAACVMAMRHEIIPPTIHCDQPDAACVVDRLVRDPLHWSVRVALANTLGCAGNAASMVLAAPLDKS
jgi:3-oxoacyl-[acyl-carrier-protein] synthase II